jgi:HlyD family secretion protein
MSVKEKSSFSSKVPLFVGFLTMLVLITGFVTWGVRANIAGAVVAPGRLVVDKNRQVVQHPDGGVVEEILVEEGDAVAEGDILVKLDPSLLESQLTLVEGQLFELIARRGLLEAERDGLEKIVFDPILKENAEQFPAITPLTEGQVQLFEARRETLVKQIEQLRNRRTQLNNQVQGIDAQKAAIGRQKALIKDELSNQEILLEKGLAQASRVLSLQREEARLAGTMGDLVARRAQALDGIAQLEIEELQLTTTRREEAISRLRDVEYNERGLAEERRSLRQQLDRLDIRAPISGIVYDMRVYGRKSVIRPAEPVLNLVPQDRPLIIEARVNTLHVDQIYLHQQVILRVAAFDMRNTPDLFGRVTQISPDAFVDEQTGDSWYRVEIVLPEEELKKLSDGQILIPGMPVESFIRTEDHSPVAYLMVPLTRYFEKAFRDG